MPAALLATVAARVEWVGAVVAPQQLLDLAAFAASPGRVQQHELKARAGLVASHPQWFLPPRPVSEQRSAVLDIHTSPLQLGKAVARAKQTGRSQAVVGHGSAFFRGFEWHSQIEVVPVRGRGLRFDLRLRATHQGAQPHCGQRTPSTMVLLQGAPEADIAAPVRKHQVAVPLVGGWRWRDPFGMGMQSAWQAEPWRQRRLMSGRKVAVRLTLCG